ncbi:MAG: hypothetical protein ACRBCT_00155 [Alphaproteobacteria bacterium]
MQVNVKQFLAETGIKEPFYPGKRIIHKCQQPGDYKSHCVILDWRNPEKIKIEVKAGLSGRDLEPQRLKYYPVCFQTPTFVNIEVVNDNEEQDEEEEGKASGKGGSGGKKPKKSLSDMKALASEAFGSVMEGKVPELGKIVEMVVMGTQIAAEGYAQAMGQLAHGIAHAKIAATDLLASAGQLVSKVEPPAFMKPKGNETVKYNYSAEKNADIGYSPGMM